jgi:hypothetical protein
LDGLQARDVSPHRTDASDILDLSRSQLKAEIKQFFLQLP